jgi:hypothetical protein
VKLIFLHGLPGVGKLTVARELAQLTGFRLFHNHLAVDLVASVFEFGSPPFVELREKIWLDMFSAAAATNTNLIFTFAPDHTVTQDFIDKVRAIADVTFVELRCSSADLEKRIADPSRRTFGKLASVTQFRELDQAGAFKGPRMPPPQLVVDTSEMSAADAAKMIARTLSF